MRRIVVIAFALSFALVTTSVFARELTGVITETKCGGP
jgi:hypothetical protein